MASSFDRVTKSYLCSSRYEDFAQKLLENTQNIRINGFSPFLNDNKVMVQVGYTWTRVNGTAIISSNLVWSNFQDFVVVHNDDFFHADDLNEISSHLHNVEKLPSFNCSYLRKPGKKGMDGTCIRDEFIVAAKYDLQERTRSSLDAFRARAFQEAGEYRQSQAFADDTKVYLVKEIKLRLGTALKPFGEVPFDLMNEAFNEWIVSSTLSVLPDGQN